MTLYRKYNSSPYLDSLLVEAKGLVLLADNLTRAGVESVRVPGITSVSEQELVIDRVKPVPPSPWHMTCFGEGLACLHSVAQATYGLDYDNCIGLSRQHNRVCSSWGAFFVDDRLGYQIELIVDANVRNHFARALASQRSRLVAFLDRHCEFPSLLHGDLWSGNVLYDEAYVWLIDPAVYYGDREADLAMTELFGGFSEDFYRAYNERLPCSRVYPEKKAIYNLYHTLNHYNLFGSSYLPACRRSLKVIEGL